MEFSRRAQAVSPFYAMEYGRRAAELEAAGTPVAKLNLGEPDFGAPPAFLAEIRRIADGRPLPYTGALGLPELREAIARFSGEHFGAPIPAERVVVTTGASAALLLACAALIDPGDEVLVADPSYPCNRRFAESFGACVRLLPTTAAERFQLSADTVAGAWSESTRGVMVASPSNPTGTSLHFDDLTALCAATAERGGWRIVDEIYLGLADDEADGSGPRSVAAVDPGAIVVNSFSKYFGLTGWRLGWAVVPEEMVPVAERLAQNYYICPPTPAQIAALTCFEPETIAVAEERRAQLRRRRRLVLDALPPSLTVPVEPDGAFYVYIDVSDTGLTATQFCDRALTEAHVALTPGKDFGDVGAERFVRLSYAAPEADLVSGLERLGEMLS